MPDPQPISIEVIHQRDLAEMGRRVSEAPERFGTVPITRIRAEALSRNPYAAPDDEVLFIARDATRCIGYHVLLPGLLRTAQAYHKVFWTSTFYVAPEARGCGVGGRLVQRMMQPGRDIVITGITRAAERIYQRSGAIEIGAGSYYQLSPERMYPFVPPLVPPRSSSSPVNIDRWRYLFTRWWRYCLALATWPNPPDSSAIGIRLRMQWPANLPPPDGLPRFWRDHRAIDWMLSHKWLYSHDQDPPQKISKDVQHYYFTGVCDRFRFFNIELLRANAVGSAGAMVISVSHHKDRVIVKLLDHYLPHETLQSAAGKVLLWRAWKENADRIHMPESVGAIVKRSSWLAPMLKRKLRPYMAIPAHADSPLARSRGHLHFELFDGDTSFT